jgi:hypothetical protein
MPHTRPNIFAGPYVDRLEPRRGDAAAVAAALADPSARLVPVWRSRNLLRRAPAPAACLLEVGVHLRHGIDPGQLILLGRFGQHCAFAAEFGGEEAPDLGAEGEFVDLRLAGGALDVEEAGLLAYARAMVTWRRRHRFCGRCGAPMRAEQAGHVMICTAEHCLSPVFPRLDPAVIVLVTDGQRALLGRQASWPEGRYSTIAGPELPLVATLAVSLLADARLHRPGGEHQDRPRGRRTGGRRLVQPRTDRPGQAVLAAATVGVIPPDRGMVRRRRKPAARRGTWRPALGLQALSETRGMADRRAGRS